MSARVTTADIAYENRADREVDQGEVPSGTVIDNSYAMDEPAGVAEKHGTGPGGAIGTDAVNPVIKDEDPVEDPIDPNTANSNEMLEQDEKEAINTENILGGSRTRYGGRKVAEYREPDDEEGMPPPEDGTSSLRTGGRLT
ncbi:hypothetical protein BGX38DRAFT_1271040 [Terfezia claveryi]|nr:hypothetical protein BGX38DRAFT_1271040 [Terfezia claveryi]